MSGISVILVSAILFHSTALAQSFKLNAKASFITFTISNFGVDVEGSLTEVKGKIFFSETDLDASLFEIQIETNSITTGIALRDKHLKNETYFDVEKYPRITFRSMDVKRISPGQYMLMGNLFMKGKTKVVSILFRVSLRHNMISFVGSLAIDRKDYGIGKNSLTMGDEVRIQLHVVAEPDSL